MKSSVSRTSTDALIAKWSALSAGYMPVVEHAELYNDLLDSMVDGSSTSKSKRRQTPLVNAGYATRVASISFAISKFVSYHSGRDPHKPIQILYLGCGLDIIGLWSSCLGSRGIQIFEIDTPEVCAKKKEILLDKGFVQPTVEVSSSGIIFEGRINVGNINEGEPASNYTLLSADLRNIGSVESALSMTRPLDESLPTLVVTELVLAYLGMEGTDQLLQWCASRICVAPGSSMVAFEPLGKRQGICSVIEDYKLEYSNQFQLKLSRGISQSRATDAKSKTEGGSFHPLGVSCCSVEERLRTCGFQSAHCSLGGNTARWASAAGAKVRESCELFDEHAALVLHLSSYALACTFSRGTDTLLRSIMCPWQSLLSSEVVFRPVKQKRHSPAIFLAPLESIKDDKKIQSIFTETYQGLCEEFPAVRKMVKTALKTDFFATSQSVRTDSSIGAWYRQKGGEFVVAVLYRKREVEETSGDGIQDVFFGEIIGGIGIRKCTHKEGLLRSEVQACYEIHRLFVCESCRGRGLGKALLLAAEEVAYAKSCGTFRMVATTLSFLTPANKLYLSNGFLIRDEAKIGNLDITTFVKDITAP